ncbi:hypothetical protein Vau01_118930 [Virgisporangium aurantiacum]|uniref:Prepilin type IV endopeptidase peptidase domain-containing protein n=1 Tax=Virgisporangium aurantiacum TaxID=175570 RepID=A0A8J4EA43_9ACTN|nr:hypothetical protein Vau01_118930 [Virgisporangium aurantiacum]
MLIAPALAVVAATVLGGLIGRNLSSVVHRLSASRPDQNASATPTTSDLPRCPIDSPPRDSNRVRRCHTICLASAATSGLLTARFLHSPLLPVLLISGLLAVAAAFVDLRSRRLPNVLILPAAAMCAAAIAAHGVVVGDLHRPLRAFASGASVGIILLVLATATGGLGLGDVKAATWTAMLAGWQSPAALTIAAVGPFLLQAPVALALLATKRIDRRSALPFGPALLVGGLLALILTR